MKKSLQHIAPILLIGMLVACAAPGTTPDPTGTEAPRSTPEELEPMPPETGDATSSGVPDDLLSRILEDAEARTDATRDDVEIVRAEAVTWNDGSLGCPEPGMMYTQALVDGYHVVLRAGETELDYRAAQSGNFKVCTDPAGERMPKS